MRMIVEARIDGARGWINFSTPAEWDQTSESP